MLMSGSVVREVMLIERWFRGRRLAIVGLRFRLFTAAVGCERLWQGHFEPEPSRTSSDLLGWNDS
jgi:hypothetical protein